jgi:ubiquinone/menaquinone biosynthesis C-methylase UbiE
MESDEASRQWDNAAPGRARWEPVLAKWLAQPTEVMLDHAGVVTGSRVIDIACGVGDQSRVAARRVGPAGFVLATDISPAVLDFAAAGAREAGLDTIATHACPAEELPRERGPFDSAICRLGLMLFPNPRAAVASAHDVLRPGGRFGAIVFGAASANPYYVESMAILRRHASKPTPASGPGPFALADSTALTALLEDHGFDDVSVTRLDVPYNWKSLDDAITYLRDASYRALIGDRPEAVQEAAWAEVRTVLGGFTKQHGGVVFPSQLLVAGGRKPE